MNNKPKPTKNKTLQDGNDIYGSETSENFNNENESKMEGLTSISYTENNDRADITVNFYGAEYEVDSDEDCEASVPVDSEVVTTPAAPDLQSMLTNAVTETEQQIVREEYQLDPLSQKYLEAVDTALKNKIVNSDRKKAYTKAGISSAIVEGILSSHQDTLLLHRASQEVYKYTDGYFKRLLPAEIRKYLTDLIKITPALLPAFSGVSFLTNLTSAFKKEILTRVTEELELFEPKFLSNVVPYEDTLVFTTPEGLTFKEHDPKYRLAYKLPWKYTDDSKIPNTLAFLNFALSNNQQDILFIQAFIRCAMASNNTHGKFLELVGKSGTGKSTLTEIISAIVGRDNSMPISMRSLNKSRFGTATIADKQLTVINEVSKYKGDTGVFQDLVGGSASIEAERKGKDGFKFTYNGNVVTNGNYLIRNNDEMAALKRRRIIIRFDKVPKEPRLLFYDDGNNYTGELVEEIPKIMAWALELSESEAVEILKNAHNDPIQKTRLEESVAEINPVFEFVRDCFLVTRNCQDDEDNQSQIFPQDRWKYGSFSQIVEIPGEVRDRMGTGIIRKKTKESIPRDKRNYQANLPLIHLYRIWCNVHHYKVLLNKKQFTNQFKLALEHFGIEYKEVSDSGVQKIVGIETTWDNIFHLAEEAVFWKINQL